MIQTYNIQIIKEEVEQRDVYHATITNRDITLEKHLSGEVDQILSEIEKSIRNGKPASNSERKIESAIDYSKTPSEYMPAFD